ncbi:taste receptor type 2 member 42-like [Sorex fumeus]|uniref:taste receptor type 2 member 42-like n=1 Tax=Sorex fumeus TaxID=62283 RepID=UPI0024AE01D8|nr:taste receptor type 2 member 42-like [Sorex fumeus]
MSTSVKVFWVLTIGEFILGTLGNGFIALVNCMKWVKNGKFTSVDFLLTSLAMTRIVQLWITLPDSFIVGFFPHLYATGELARAFTVLWTLNHHLATWFATCLSIFYFLKIANFSNSLFIWLKWRMNSVVLVLFLGSFFLLFVNLLIQDSFIEHWKGTYRVYERNMTLNDITETFQRHSLVISLIYVIPFLLSLTSLVLLFLSLVRHTKNLQLKSLNSKDSYTEAHRRAMTSVAAFLLLLIIYFTVCLTANWILFEIQRYQAIMIIMMFSMTFPSVHSFIIILGNRKLRQSALRILGHLKLSGRKTRP